MLYENYTKNDLRNEIEYLRIALGLTVKALQNMKDNLESGRVQITILDDGPAHPGNMDNGIKALDNAKTCLEMTNPHTR